jgi:pilus assembly protein CpaC
MEQLKAIALFPYKLELNANPQIHLNESQPQLRELSRFVQSYGIRIVLSPTALSLEPIVKVHITVAEIKKSTANKYGIGWQDSYPAKILPKGLLMDDLEISLNAMEASGEGKVLASPNLICRSGKEADFFAGGEFPIKIINFKLQDIVWKKYGILLKVKPTADMSGRMSITIETEVSGFDGSKTVDGFPGLYLNRVQSTFDLTESRTIALSGLLKKEDHQQNQGIFGLANLPILGSLFSSKDFREDKTELVIFVRPEITNLAANGSNSHD